MSKLYAENVKGPILVRLRWLHINSKYNFKTILLGTGGEWIVPSGINAISQENFLYIWTGYKKYSYTWDIYNFFD